jgi:hypothetical protein
VGTVNIGSRAPTHPPPYLYCDAQEGPTAMNTVGAPDQVAWGDPTIAGVILPGL